MPFSRSISRTASTISCVIVSPFVDQVAAHDRVVRDLDCLVAGAHFERTVAGTDELAAEPRTAVDRLVDTERDLAADRPAEMGWLAERPVEPGRRDLDRVAVEVAVEQAGHTRAERVVDALRMVDIDGHALGPTHLHGEHLDAGKPGLDRLSDLPQEAPFLVVCVRSHRSQKRKWAPRAHFVQQVKCGERRIAISLGRMAYSGRPTRLRRTMKTALASAG